MALSQYNVLNSLFRGSIIIQPGTNVQIGIDVELVNTTEAAKRRFTPEQRNCYFDDEFDLRWTPQEGGFSYSLTNCLVGAGLSKISKNCNCSLIQYSSFVEDPRQDEACRGKSIYCANKILGKRQKIISTHTRRIRQNFLNYNCY